jgi:hypothetical protein
MRITATKTRWLNQPAEQKANFVAITLLLIFLVDEAFSLVAKY